MKISHTTLVLSLLVAVLALAAAGAGFFWPQDGAPVTVTSVRGETVTLYGRGLYRYDTLFTGAANRGNDAVTLLLGIPLLVYATLRYWRGSRRGAMLLLGTLVYFLYVYSSYSLGIAFNPLFPLYIALFSASLFGFVVLFASLARPFLADHFAPDLPRRPVAIFMLVSGVVTLVIWLQPLLDALLHNGPPARLGTYTTKITDVLDLGIITPATWIAGIFIWRRRPLGYLVAFGLLVLEIMLMPLILAQTISQWLVGITYTPAEIIGPMLGFATLGFFALWVLRILLRHTSDPSTDSSARWHPAHA